MIDLASEISLALHSLQTFLRAPIRPAFIVYAALWGLLLQPPPAQAQAGGARARARELGQQGLADLDGKRYAAAEERLSEAIALYPAPTLYIARSQAREAQGKLVAAAQDLRTVTQMPPVADEPAAYGEARNTAKKRLPALDGRVGRLVVLVSGGPAEVTVNGTPWPAAVHGQAVPVDPGVYRAHGQSAEGEQEAQVQVAEGQTAELKLAFAAGQPASGESAAAASYVQPEPPPRPDSLPGAPVPLPADDGGPGVGAYVVGTLTLAAAVATGTTGILYLNKRTDYHELNRDMEASEQERKDARGDASTMGWISTGFGLTTAIGLALSTYMFLASDSSEQELAASSMSASVGPSGISLQGKF